MATLSRFEQLKVWQDARSFDRMLFAVIKDADERRDGFLKNHILKTSGSIMDNIAEGFERDGNREFIQFLSISKGSAGELRSQLYRALDHEMIRQNDFEILQSNLVSLSQQLSNFIKYLNSSSLRGNRFKESRAIYSINNKLDQFFTEDLED